MTISDDFDFGEQNIRSETSAMATDTSPPIFEDFEPLDICEMDLDNLKPRRWVYGKLLVRGHVSCFAGNGGTGKTSLALAVAMSVATGRSLIAEDDDDYHRVHKQGAALYFNLEDPLDEMKLRLAAEVRHRAINKADLDHKLYLASGRDHPLCVASLDKAGRVLRHDIAPAVALLRRLGIIALTIDPLVNAHAVDGNRNDYLAVVVDQFRRIADQADCAILIVHHFRKGGQAGDVESSLGAVTLTNSCRVVETVTTMSEADATALGVAPNRRRSYVRKDNAKLNLSAAPTESDWYEFQSVGLGNGDADYPDGDSIGVLTRWQPASPMFGVAWTQVGAVLDAIEAGVDGEYHSGSVKSVRWAGNLMMTHMQISDGQAKVVLKEWLDQGVLKADKYQSKERDHHEAQRLLVMPDGRQKLRLRMTARA
jgi:hypothetical protein